MPIQRYLACCSPTILEILLFISLDALFVKVNASIEFALYPWVSTLAILHVITLVLPEPAPAIISEGPIKLVTASF